MSDLTKEMRAWATDDIVPSDLKSVLVAAADKLDVAEAEIDGVLLTVDYTDSAQVEAVRKVDALGRDTALGTYPVSEPVAAWYARLESAKIGSTLVQTRGAGPFGPKTYNKGSYDLWYAEGGGSNVGMPSYSFSPGGYELRERD